MAHIPAHFVEITLNHNYRVLKLLWVVTVSNNSPVCMAGVHLGLGAASSSLVWTPLSPQD